MAFGDLLFYHGHGALAETLIERATAGPFCHVEVDLGDGTSIGALSRGITRHTVPTPDAIGQASHGLDEARIPAARIWLFSEVRQHYGWWDIAADIAQALLPQRLGSCTPFLVMPSQLDCSALAATFLTIAGFALPAHMIADLHRVSPNDLARVLCVPTGVPAPPALPVVPEALP